MTILEKLILPEVRELIREGNLDLLCETLGHFSPADVADLLDDCLAFGALFISLIFTSDLDAAK